MGKVDVLKETTPLSSEDCFLVMQRPKSGFNFPLHVHMEFELNYLENAAGAIRIVGDSVEEIDDLDLVLIAGGTKHAYSNHKCPCNGIFEITIQFHMTYIVHGLKAKLQKATKKHCHSTTECKYKQNRPRCCEHRRRL